MDCISKEKSERLYSQELNQKSIAGLNNHGKSWSKEEIDYLEEKYGLTSIPTIAKKLGRTEQAIIIKAKRLGLGGVLDATELLNSSQLAIALNVDKSTTIRWIKEKGLKASFRKIGLKRRFYLISLENFWKWAEENHKIINWLKFQEGALGKEPLWAKEVRKNFKIEKNATKRWTEKEDSFLKMYWKEGKSCKEIAKILHRTPVAIKKRTTKLNLEKRNIQIPWKPIEVQTLIEMKLNGALDVEIAEELGRGVECIAWKRKELVKEGKLNWKYDRKKNGRNSTGKLKMQPLKNTQIEL